jgi:ABC-type multidrug transport system fused ATPase/permease subunit
VIDEGTSAVDPATDIAIQTALRVSATKNGTTILAIAHRLATIKDFDKILVMGDGKVLEYDTPQSLLANQNSQFAKMILDNKESNN